MSLKKRYPNSNNCNTKSDEVESFKNFRICFIGFSTNFPEKLDRSMQPLVFNITFSDVCWNCVRALFYLDLNDCNSKNVEIRRFKKSKSVYRFCLMSPQKNQTDRWTRYRLLDLSVTCAKFILVKFVTFLIPRSLWHWVYCVYFT